MAVLHGEGGVSMKYLRSSIFAAAAVCASAATSYVVPWYANPVSTNVAYDASLVNDPTDGVLAAKITTAWATVSGANALSGMGMCLDIGHNYRSGKDPAACIRKYADRLIDFHLKDITPHTTDIKADAKILGRGVLDLPGIVKALADVGYSGSCSLEYETNFKDNFADLCECVGYFKALMRTVA